MSKITHDDGLTGLAQDAL